MALARTHSVALVGVQGHVIEIEADLASGIPGCAIVGLPDTAVGEARERMRAATVNSGQAWPSKRITVGLSPASLPKKGSIFDLAMAVTVLAAAGSVPVEAAEKHVLLGELGLDGRIRPIRGVLPCVLAASRAGYHQVVVPHANAAEARLVPDVDVHAAVSLRGLLARFRGEPLEEDATPVPGPAPHASIATPVGDLADVVGQSEARRALEVAAAGAHHVFLLGPPGCGKTMLAERLPGVLPDLDTEAALEVTAVHSIAGVLGEPTGLVGRPPFAAPHHSVSLPSLIGGGSGLARPGSASLAHQGILFLDEAPEFSPHALDALRQPLETGVLTIGRAQGESRFPARFTLVLAANPCPCGGGPAARDTCSCTPLLRRRYLGRLSGPLLDRIDIQQTLHPLSRADLLALGRSGESSATVAARVTEARSRARRRLADTPWRTNAEVPGRHLRKRLAPAPTALTPLHKAYSRGALTARGVDRVLRLAWTVADLAGRDRPSADDVGTALVLRGAVA